MLVTLDTWERSEVATQMLLPVVALNKHGAILQAHKLGDVDVFHWRAVPHDSSNVIQSVHSGLPEALLDKAKAPVGAKLGVACNQEVEGQCLVKAMHGPPCTVPQHEVVLVLPTATVNLNVQFFEGPFVY